MDKSPIEIDEFGTLRFSVYRDNGYTFDFEQEPDSIHLFITTKDAEGRTLGKRVVDTHKVDNKEIVEIYRDYIKDRESNEGN